MLTHIKGDGFAKWVTLSKEDLEKFYMIPNCGDGRAIRINGDSYILHEGFWVTAESLDIINKHFHKEEFNASLEEIIKS